MIPLKNIRCVLVDLDDTLVACSPFVKPYFIWQTCRAFSGIRTPWQMFTAIRDLKRELSTTCGVVVNHERLIHAFADHSGMPTSVCRDLYEKLTPQILQSCQPYFGPIQGARRFMELLGSRYEFVLATNPFWPESFARLRLDWAGIKQDPFTLITHSHNMKHCKPNTRYYEETLSHLKVPAEACLFIGNDFKKDAPAIFAGLTTVIITKNRQWKLCKAASAHNAALLSASWNTLCQYFTETLSLSAHG